jgi:uncharacterized membrane protein YqiK
MAFRDQQESLRARVEAQEKELAELRARLADRSVTGSPGLRTRVAAIALAAGGLVLVLLAMYLRFELTGSAGELWGIAAVMASIVFALAFVLAHVEVAGPHEALVLSGRAVRLPDGSTRAFRIAHGRTFRVPFLERVDRMDLRPFAVDVVIDGVFLRGGVRARVCARAVLELARVPTLLTHAVERFVGRERREIAEVARATLEGAARAVLTSTTKSELETEPARVTDVLRKEAEPDLEKLGLALSALSIVEVDA